MDVSVWAGTAILHNGQSHCLASEVTIACRDGVVVDVHRGYAGDGPPTIDARNSIVAPGFVNLHSHTGIFADARLRPHRMESQAFGEGFLSTVPAVDAALNPADPDLEAELKLWQMRAWGSTTSVEVGATLDQAKSLIKLNAAYGLRLVIGLRVHDATYEYDSRGKLGYSWSQTSGKQGLEQSADFLRSLEGEDSLVSGLVVPWQLDTVSPDTLSRSLALASEFNVPIQIHAGQNLFEVAELSRRHGLSPLELLKASGALMPRTTIAHGLLLGAGGTDGTLRRSELDSLLASGTNVAQSPMAYSRLGTRAGNLHSMFEYGINVGLGTDTHPRDMFGEMRFAGALQNWRGGSFSAESAARIYTAATVGGAVAIGRSDLGVVAPGARADMIVIDRLHPGFGGPIYDPIVALVEGGSGDAVAATMVDGQIIYRRPDRGSEEQIRSLSVRAQAHADETFRSCADWHYTREAVLAAFPQSFPVWEE